jgi:hypothetical protein
LNVRYVISGSVRQAGDRLRITAQLIDSGTSGHVWGMRHDRSLSDIFALQDEISKTIADVLKVQLLPSEMESIASRSTSSSAAYEYFCAAALLISRFSTSAACASPATCMPRRWRSIPAMPRPCGHRHLRRLSHDERSLHVLAHGAGKASMRWSWSPIWRKPMRPAGRAERRRTPKELHCLPACA